jgi:CBS domain-containing protein
MFYWALVVIWPRAKKQIHSPKETTMLVSDYMSKSPLTIDKGADYDAAFGIMEDGDLHHLPVVDKKRQVVGILARRDLQLAARHFHEAPAEVGDVMHTPVLTISPTASLTTAAKRMADNRIGCLPVLNRGKNVVGMITETDLFHALIDALGGKTAPKKAGEKKKAKKKAKKKG